MKPTILIVAALSAATIGSTQAALISRLGGQAVYDNFNNITWIANGNLAATNTFGLPVNQEFRFDHTYYSSSFTHMIYTDGSMSWAAAGAYVNQMNQADYLGYSNWTLPYITPFCDTCTNPFMSLQTSLQQIDPSKSIYENASGLFINLNGRYWSSTPYPGYYPGYAYYYIMGGQMNLRQVDQIAASYQVIAYKVGDVAQVSTVPAPPTFILMLTGLGLLGLTKRLRKTA